MCACVSECVCACLSECVCACVRVCVSVCARLDGLHVSFADNLTQNNKGHTGHN